MIADPERASFESRLLRWFDRQDEAMQTAVLAVVIALKNGWIPWERDAVQAFVRRRAVELRARAAHRKPGGDVVTFPR